MATVTVETRPGHPFAMDVTAREFTFVSDEPSPDGEDLGPSPYELLLAALGSCTAMTLEMYARRKGWPLERVNVHLTFERVHSEDAANSESTSPRQRIEIITRDIELIGPLDDAQRARIMEIAAKCPVHRTITGSPQIVDRLRKSEDAGSGGQDGAEDARLTG
ncbi:MAG TPA: OsmC family protein [Thermomicrobiales bacterium]